MSRAPNAIPQHILQHGKPEPPANLPAPPQTTEDTRTFPPHHSVPGMRARAHAATNLILGAAHAWWASRRPLSYTLHQHLQNPTVNTCGEDERDLALAVAEWIQAATAPGTWPQMPYQARQDEHGRVIGYTRPRTPLEAALFRSGLSVAQLARQLGVRERALHRWCAGAKPHAPYRKLLEEWMAQQDPDLAQNRDMEDFWKRTDRRPWRSKTQKGTDQ